MRSTEREPDHTFPAHEKQGVTNDERRRHARYQVTGLKSDITDGNSAFLVAVEDLSKNGVGLSQVPANFDATAKKCFAVINGPHQDFKLILKPRWTKVSGKGDHKKIGFEIENPSPEWLEFVGSFAAHTGDNRQEKGKRLQPLGLLAVISDGRSTYFAVVEEISEKGVRLSQIPPSFDDQTGSCSATIHSPAGELHIALVPCWAKSTNRGMYKSVGFQIKNPPADWQGFIHNMEEEVGTYSYFLLKNERE